MASVRAIREACPNHLIIADMKTMDNATYEMGLCFQAGANLATVMAAAPMPTIMACKIVADQYEGRIAIDLLATDPARWRELQVIRNVVWCFRVGKDERELAGKSVATWEMASAPEGCEVAVAGGVTLGMVPSLRASGVDIVVIGSAIVKAPDPVAAAKAFRDAIDVDGGYVKP